MTDFLTNRVRPTSRCLRDIGLSFPDLAEPLWRIAHPLIARMQIIPDETSCGGAEPVRSLNDRIWWKCKTSNLRGVVTRLTRAECLFRSIPESAPWWGGAAGTRRDDSATDFYRQIEAESLRQGRGTGGPSTSYLLPQRVDVERLSAEAAMLTVQAMRHVVLDLVARSLRDGKPYTAILSCHKVTALVRAPEGEEAYLAVAAEGFIHPEIIALIISAVPGINDDDWQPEPGGVADISPQPGQIIWSTIIPPEVQEVILARVSGLE